jgi:hypothetical protein
MPKPGGTGRKFDCKLLPARNRRSFRSSKNLRRTDRLTADKDIVR